MAVTCVVWLDAMVCMAVIIAAWFVAFACKLAAWFDKVANSAFNVFTCSRVVEWQ